MGRTKEQIEEFKNKVLIPLKPYLDDWAEKEAFERYVGRICGDDKLNIQGDHIGYIEENILLSKLIPKHLIVVDVGCGFGFQQVLFRNHKKYIGIQRFWPSNTSYTDFAIQKFCDNAEFITGWFRDVISMIGITNENKNDYFGIANHSLLNNVESEADIAVFNHLFRKKYINGGIE